MGYPSQWREYSYPPFHTKPPADENPKAKAARLTSDHFWRNGSFVAFRVLQQIRPHASGPATSFVVLPGPLNAFFKAILFAEVELSRLVPLPFGSTIYLVAEKPATQR